MLAGTYATGTDAQTGLAYVELPNVVSFSPFALSGPTPTGVALSRFAARAGGLGWPGYLLGGAAALLAAGALAFAARRRKPLHAK
jgi:hypothetical protein